MLHRPNPPENLLAALQAQGIRAWLSTSEGEIQGFPVKLELLAGETLILDLENPLGCLAPNTAHFGVAIMDELGFVRRTWGLAESIPEFKSGASTFFSGIGQWVQEACCGVPVMGYKEGRRFYFAPLDRHTGRMWIVVMDAAAEKSALNDADYYLRESSALKRLGRSLNLDLNIDSLAQSAIHELSSVGNLAAGLLWVSDSRSPGLNLKASTGIRRAGTQALARLNVDGTMACLAEFVALSHKPIYIAECEGHLLTSSIEAKICYLNPGALSLWPLISGGNLMGVIELIGRKGDKNFEEQMDLFETFSEHLALALNSSTLYESAQRRASYDSLTDIANHKAMHEFLNARLSEAERKQTAVGFLLIDVDHFRGFNEEEGHQTGDEVLKIVARTMSGLLRPYDLAARYGGEEFAAVLPEASSEECKNAAERIRKAIESLPFVTRSGRNRHITVSIGYATYPNEASDATSLIQAADQALYQAKHEGRNRVCQFTGTLHLQVSGEERPWEDLQSLMTIAESVEASEALDRSQPWIASAGTAFNLSTSQTNILRSAVYIYPRFNRAIQSDDGLWKEQFLAHGASRLIEPTLSAMNERFDGLGPGGRVGQQIPLLTRVLQGILALAETGGREAAQDAGRFDPEVVAWMSTLEDAA